MRRLKLVLGVAAMMMALLMATAAPALATHRFDGDDDADCFLVDGFLFCEDDGFVNFFDDDDGFGDGGIVQDVEQEAESGDIDQNFDVSGTGDNSNQTVGSQGTANTGNAQNFIRVIDAGD